MNRKNPYGGNKHFVSADLAVPTILFSLFASIVLTPNLNTMLSAESVNSTPSSSFSGEISDFNNDGYDDLAIAVPGEDIGSIVDAGAVNVIYGSSAGLSATAIPDQIWTQDRPNVDDNAESLDKFGFSLAAGDYNGDEYSDLAVGVPGESIGSAYQTGAVHVLYGGAGAGLQTNSPADQLWSQASPSIEDIAENADHFGWGITSGDFNKDGYDDLAVGAVGEGLTEAGRTAAGAVNVIYGSFAGLSAVAVVGTGRNDQFWHQDIPGIEDAAEDFDAFGYPLTAADFNKDGYDDLAVGVPQERLGDMINPGAVNVIYGSSTGLRTSAAGDGTGRTDQFWHQDSPGMNDLAELGDLFGGSLTSADFNNDGYDDLAAGAVFEDITSVLDAGAVNVIYGSSTGLRTSAAGDGTGRTDQFWHQNSVGVEDSAESRDLFGTSLSAGDFNRDGYDDLAICVCLEDIGSIIDAGALQLFYGSSSGLLANAVGTTPGDQFWHENVADVRGNAEHGDFFGLPVVGDYNGDGMHDLAVSIPGQDVAGQDGAGAVNCFYGSSDGLQAKSPDDQRWNQDSPDIEDVAESSDGFGGEG